MKKIDFTDIGHQIQAMQKEAVKQTLSTYKPRAEEIIRSESKDTFKIEHTLEALNQVTFDKDVLSVFNKLCGYYKKIDKEAAAKHIQNYLEMWGSKEENQ